MRQTILPRLRNNKTTSMGYWWELKSLVMGMASLQCAHSLLHYNLCILLRALAYGCLKVYFDGYLR